MRLAILLLLVPVVALADEAPCVPLRPSESAEVGLKKGSKLKDLVDWYRRVTCLEINAPPNAADLPLPLAVEGKLPASRAVEVVKVAAASAGFDVIDDGRALTLRQTLARGGKPSVTPLRETSGCTLAPSAVSVAGNTVTVDAARAPGIDLECILASVRIAPAFKNGSVQGLKVFGIAPGSMFALLGFKDGDTVSTVNGRAIDSPDKMVETSRALSGEKKFDVAMERAGEPMHLNIVVR